MSPFDVFHSFYARPGHSAASATDSSNTSNSTHEALSPYFLGPQGENADQLVRLLAKLVHDQVATRKNYHPEDGEFIAPSLQETKHFKQSQEKLEKEFTYVSRLLNKYCVPFYSPRYNGHIQWEPSIPSILGSLSATIFNPNNVTFESSPFTTLVEMEVGRQFCRMVGYNVNKDRLKGDEEGEDAVVGWGHMVCGGTIANLESIWVARNLKFYPLALHEAMSPTGPLAFIAPTFRVTLPTSPSISANHTSQLFISLTPWQLLNLPSYTILSIPSRLVRQYGISPKWLEENLGPYLIQTRGKEGLVRRYCERGDHGGYVEPDYLIASTRHYSWPKGASLAGIGSSRMINVPIEPLTARLSIAHLRAALEERLQKKQAVYAVVVVVGSTEEGAVDPVEEVLEVRREFAARGMSFLVHADAAWGGYFATMIRTKEEMYSPPIFPDEEEDDDESASHATSTISTINSSSSSLTLRNGTPPSVGDDESTYERNSRNGMEIVAREDSGKMKGEGKDRDFVPTITMREWTVRQLHALKGCDSITLDPHKSGYVPFPAGSLLYRDERMKYLVTWTAPYLAKGKKGESLGMYGVEGSKPGGPAVATYLQHRVIEPHKDGHGNLLGEVSFTCRRISAHWASLSDAFTPFVIVPFNALPCDSTASEGTFTHDSPSTQAYKSFLRTHILPKSNTSLVNDSNLYSGQTLMQHLSSLGSDLNINVFACNFRVPHTTDEGKTRWVLNTDIDEANFLNRRIYERCSVTMRDKKPGDVELFLSMTVFEDEEYGECGVEYKRRLGLEVEDEVSRRKGHVVLRNVVMSPLTAAGNFVKEVATVFERVLREEMKHVVYRNTLRPMTHSFVLQGSADRKNLYLDYRPFFHDVNCKQQLILRVEMRVEEDWERYVAARERWPDDVYVLDMEMCTLEDLTSGHEVQSAGTIYGRDLLMTNVQFTNVHVVKSRSLAARHQAVHYPATHTPFYLYGSSTTPPSLSSPFTSNSSHTTCTLPPTQLMPENLHLTHILTRAPNAHLSASSVTLSPSILSSLNDEKLREGVVLCLRDRREATMQPFSTGPDPDDNDVERENSGVGGLGRGSPGANWPGSWFKGGAIFNVVVYLEEDWKELEKECELAKEDSWIAEGWVRLDGSVYVDTERLNRELFEPEDRQEVNEADVFLEEKRSLETEGRFSTTCVEGFDVVVGGKEEGNSQKKMVSDENRRERRGTCICQ